MHVMNEAIAQSGGAGAIEPASPGRALIIQLVHTFYADVRSDRILGPTFDAVIEDRWEPHLARMVEFWCTVMLETRSLRAMFLPNIWRCRVSRPGISAAGSRTGSRVRTSFFCL